MSCCATILPASLSLHAHHSPFFQFVLPAEGHGFYDFFGWRTGMFHLDLTIEIYVELGSVFSLYKQTGSVIFGALAKGIFIFKLLIPQMIPCKKI